MNTAAFMNAKSVHTKIWFMNTNGSINIISIGSMNQFVFIFAAFNKHDVYLQLRTGQQMQSVCASPVPHPRRIRPICSELSLYQQASLCHPT